MFHNYQQPDVNTFHKPNCSPSNHHLSRRRLQETLPLICISKWWHQTYSSQMLYSIQTTGPALLKKSAKQTTCLLEITLQRVLSGSWSLFNKSPIPFCKISFEKPPSINCSMENLNPLNLNTICSCPKISTQIRQAESWAGIREKQGDSSYRLRTSSVRAAIQ